MQCRDWQGMFMQHCHNTVHEDHAMLMRWEIDDGGAPFLRPLPTPIPRPQGVIFQAAGVERNIWKTNMNIRKALPSPAAVAVLAALAGAPAGAQEALMLSAPVTTNLATASTSG